MAVGWSDRGGVEIGARAIVFWNDCSVGQGTIKLKISMCVEENLTLTLYSHRDCGIFF